MSEKMREEFEEAVATGAICDGFRHQMCSYIAFMKSIKDMRTKFGYTEPVIDGAYKIWKASRAALVVELPPQWFSKVDDEEVMSAIDVIDHLIDAGVTYK